MEERVSPALAPKRSRESDVPVDAATLLGLLNKVASFPSFRTEILPKLADLFGMEQPQGPWSQPRFKVKNIPQRAPESGVTVGDIYTDEELRSVVPELEAIHQMPGIIALNPGTPGGDTPESRLKTVAYARELNNQRRLRYGRVTPEELSSQSSAVRPDPTPGKRATNAMLNMLYGSTPEEQAIDYIPGVGKAINLFGKVGMRGIEQALLLVPLGARKRLRKFFLTSENAAMPIRQSRMAGTGEQLGRTAGNTTVVQDWEAPDAMRGFVQSTSKPTARLQAMEHARRGKQSSGSFITDLESLTPEGEQGEPIVQAVGWLERRYPRIANHFREIQVKPGISMEGGAQATVYHPFTRSARTQFARGVERPYDPLTGVEVTDKPEMILEGVEMYRRRHGLSSTEPYGIFRYGKDRGPIFDKAGNVTGLGDPTYGFPPRSAAKPRPFLEMELQDTVLINPRWRELKRYLGTEDPMLRVSSEPHRHMSGQHPRPPVARYPEQFATRHGGVRDPNYQSQASHRSGYRPHEVTQPVGWDSADKEKRVLAKHWGEPTVEDLPVEQRPFIRIDQYGRPIPHALEVASISRQISAVVHEATHGAQNIRRLGRQEHINLMRSSDPEDWTKVKREPPEYGTTTRQYQTSAVEQDPQIRGATAQLEYLASEYKRAQEIGGKDALDVQNAIKDELIEIFSGRTQGSALQHYGGGSTLVEVSAKLDQHDFDKEGILTFGKALPRNILGTKGPNRNEEPLQFLKRLEESLRSRHNVDPESLGSPAGGLYNDVIKNYPDIGHKWVRENDAWKKVPYHAGMVEESVDRFIEAALSGNRKYRDKVIREEGYSLAKEAQEFESVIGDISELFKDYYNNLVPYRFAGDNVSLPLGQGVSDIVEPPVPMPGWMSQY